MSVVICEPTTSDWYRVKFAYNPQIITTIRALPKPLRRYRPNPTPAWLVHSDEVPTLRRALAADGHKVVSV